MKLKYSDLICWGCIFLSLFGCCLGGSNCDDVCIRPPAEICVPQASACVCNTDFSSCSAVCENGYAWNGALGQGCFCTGYFTGSDCSVEGNGCNGVACSPGTMCVNDECIAAPYIISCDGFDNFACVEPANCHINAQGARSCEDPDACDGNPCGEHGTCTVAPEEEGGFTCTCDTGYTGPLCDEEINACTENPCGDHGTCTVAPEEDRGFTCTCDTGYTAPLCNKPC